MFNRQISVRSRVGNAGGIIRHIDRMNHLIEMAGMECRMDLDRVTLAGVTYVTRGISILAELFPSEIAEDVSPLGNPSFVINKVTGSRMTISTFRTLLQLPYENTNYTLQQLMDLIMSTIAASTVVAPIPISMLYDSLYILACGLQMINPNRLTIDARSSVDWTRTPTAMEYLVINPEIIYNLMNDSEYGDRIIDTVYTSIPTQFHRLENGGIACDRIVNSLTGIDDVAEFILGRSLVHTVLNGGGNDLF